MKTILKSKRMQLLLDQGLFSGTNFLINLGLIKALDLESYGVFATLTMALYLLLSITQAMIIQPMQINLRKVDNVNSYKVGLLLLTSCIGILLLTGSLLMLFSGIDYLSSVSDYFFLFSFYGLAYLLFDFLRKYYLASDNILIVILMSSMYLMVVVIGFVLGFIYEMKSLNYFFLIFIVGLVSSLILGLYRYIIGLQIPSQDEIQNFVQIHIFDGQWLLYGSLIQWTSSNLYVMSSGILISMEALGVLRFVQSLFGVINILLQTIENYILPILSNTYSSSIEMFYNVFQKNSIKLQSILFISLLTLFVFSKEIMIVVGDAELESYHFVIRGMVILYFIIIAGYPIRLLVRITELNKSYFIAYLISFVFSLCTYHYFLDSYGILGAICGLIFNQLILQATWFVSLCNNQINLWRLYI